MRCVSCWSPDLRLDGLDMSWPCDESRCPLQAAKPKDPRTACQTHVCQHKQRGTTGQKLLQRNYICALFELWRPKFHTMNHDETTYLLVSFAFCPSNFVLLFRVFAQLQQGHTDVAQVVQEEPAQQSKGGLLEVDDLHIGQAQEVWLTSPYHPRCYCNGDAQGSRQSMMLVCNGLYSHLCTNLVAMQAMCWRHQLCPNLLWFYAQTDAAVDFITQKPLLEVIQKST